MSREQLAPLLASWRSIGARPRPRLPRPISRFGRRIWQAIAWVSHSWATFYK